MKDFPMKDFPQTIIALKRITDEAWLAAILKEAGVVHRIATDEERKHAGCQYAIIIGTLEN